MNFKTISAEKLEVLIERNLKGEYNLPKGDSMRDGAERENEYNNMREMIFFAKGHGVKVTAPCDAKMLRPWYKYIDWRAYRKGQ